MVKVLVLFLLLTISFSSTKADTQNPNVWNFQIARKVIASFQYSGMGMSIWEDQGVENTTVVSRRQFYVTPITEFLPNSTKCVFNELTGSNVVSYCIQLWSDRLQLAAIDRLKQMQIDVAPEQVQPLPFYQVRVIWNNAQQKLQKATLSTTWLNNLQQQSIRQFDILADDKVTCNKLATILQTQPELFTPSIALQYSLSAANVATKTLTVKTDHFLHSQLMDTLKNMDVQSPERFLRSNDANRLSLEIMDNIVASQVVDGEYVPDTDMLSLKDVVSSSLQLQNVDVGNFTEKMWQSVYWDPIFARPDTVCSYLNKVLKINQGNHTVSKSNSCTDKGEGGFDFGIDDLSFGASGSSESSGWTSYNEMVERFRQHNYEVEIKGELFVPKSLSLNRLNMGVLSRRETIYSKSVQMHHVDAPGLLTVTVGSKWVVESEDIKQLREATNSLNSDIKQLKIQSANHTSQFVLVQGRMGQMELRLDEELDSGMANTTKKLSANMENLNAKIDNINTSLTKALSTKLSACTLNGNSCRNGWCYSVSCHP